MIPLLLSVLLVLATPAPAVAEEAAQPAPLAAQPPSTSATTPYRVKPGLIFNDPTGSSVERRRIVTQVTRAVDNAPKGSLIRIAQYLNDLEAPTDRLIAAHKRGVRVQLLIDDYPISEQTARLRRAIGTNRGAASFVTRCDNGCMSSQPGVMHAKFFLFSKSGASTKVSMISSANLYTGNTRTSWNNLHTIVGDNAIYDSLTQYFGDMVADRDRPNYFRTTTSGVHKLYFYPRQAPAYSNKIVLLDALRKVRCRGAARGYGDAEGRTVVRVEQWGWNSGRLDIAQQLVRLQSQGCNVQVILNSFKTTRTILRTLLTTTGRGRIRVYNAGIDTNGNGQRDKYMHHKVIAINGVWDGRNNEQVTFTGSANFTGKATLTNNEIIMRVLSNKTYDAYADNFIYIRERWTRRVTSVPSLYAADRQVDRQLAEDRQLEEDLELEAELDAGLESE